MAGGLYFGTPNQMVSPGLPLSGGTLTGPLLLPAGTAGAGTLSWGFSTDTDTGVISGGSGLISFVSNGTAGWRVDLNELFQVGSGGVLRNFVGIRQGSGGVYLRESDSTGGCNFFVNEITSSALSGASVTLSAAIPAGALLLGVCARVTTTITGATTWKLGTIADDDLFGATLALASGTTTSNTSYTAAPSAFWAAATDLVITANGSNFTGGVVKVYVSYVTAPAPTG